jgi:hypothetical protein
VRDELEREEMIQGREPAEEPGRCHDSLGNRTEMDDFARLTKSELKADLSVYLVEAKMNLHEFRIRS